jgi:hypothetical protein
MGVKLRLLGSVAVSLALLVGVVSSAQARSAAHGPKHRVGKGTSTNWTGATHVIGTWTQPAVTCAAGENRWSSPWVGIDGDTSNTVEQTGTDSDCQSGRPVYYAWYEMYPKSTVQVSMAVHPGDVFTGQVTYTGGGSFTLKLTDNTTGASYTTTQSSKKAQRSSVEWIMEGPSNGLLSDFGSVPFSAASATINGQTGGLSSFPNPESITMVNNAGVVRAQPSAVSSNAFSVAWKHG